MFSISIKGVLPAIEGAAQFMLDFLMECPVGLSGEDHLITCPSHSPENRFKAPNGQVTWLTYGASMDSEIIHDLFTIYLDSLKALGGTSEYAARVEAARARLVPPGITPDGRLMEWIDDYEEIEPGHRHVSHLRRSRLRSRKCWPRATRAALRCCPRCPPPGPTAKSKAFACAADTFWTSNGKTVRFKAPR